MSRVVDGGGVSFFLETDKGTAPLEEWYRHNRCLDSVEFTETVLTLRQMQSEGLAEVSDDRVKVTSESLYQLETTDLLSLHIAPLFPFLPVLSCISDMAHDDFRYQLRYERFDRSPAPVISRLGCCFEAEAQRWLIPQSLWGFLRSLMDACADQSEEDRLLRFHTIRKNIAASSGRIDDSYLAGLEVIVPEELRLELEPEAGSSFRVLPKIEYSANRVFQKAFRSRVRNVYPLNPDSPGGLKRLVFKKEHRENLKEIKSLEGLKGEQKARFLEKPELFLSTETVDLCDFPRQAARFGGGRHRASITREAEGTVLSLQPLVEQAEALPTTSVVLSRERAAELLVQLRDAREAGKSEVSLGGLPPVLAQKSLEIHLETVVKPDPPVLDERHEKLEVPGTLAEGVSLLPHQLEGLEWLQGLFCEGAAGALLADDMGLGKTLQLLTFFEWLRHRMDTMGPSLLIAPIGLLYNWQQEYHKFFRGDRSLTESDILPLFGENLKLFERSDRSLDVGAVSRHPLVLTSYETLRSRRQCFEQLTWTLVILDEAQKVKNPRALVTETVKSLDSIFRVACTGTPVENSLSDLWTLMDFASPGLLGPRKTFLREHEPQSEAEYESLGERIEEKLGDRFLRRRKSDILKDLPPKHERSPRVVMKGLQHDQYQGATANYDSSNALELISRLRRLSCTADCDAPRGGDYGSFSAKLQWVIELLREVRASNEKALIFVEYRDVQRILAEALGKEFGLTVDMINGDVPAAGSGKALTRTQMIEAFEQRPGFNVLILSPLAAGFGLTITAANHVVHFLRHWNPAKEDQATDRAYRIGQTRPVHVYYPAATLPNAKSFDERLGELLDEKRRLAASAVFPSMFGKVVAEEMLDILDSSLAGQDARVKASDLDDLNRGAKLGVLAALLRKSNHEVYAVDRPGLDLLAFHREKNSYLISLDLPATQKSELQAGCLHFQQHAPGKLDGCVVFTTRENLSKLTSHDWSRVELDNRLTETPIYWKDVYQRVPFYAERSEERTAAQIEKATLDGWTRVFGESIVAVSQQTDTTSLAPFELKLGGSQLCFTGSHGLAIRLPALSSLPRFVKELSLSYGAQRQVLQAQPARYAPTFLSVEPIEGSYRWSAPGFEEEVDDELEALNLSLTDRLPTLFLQQADDVYYQQKSKRVSPDREYGVLIPPEFTGMAPPSHVQRTSLDDWKFDRFQVSEEVCQEIRVYLAQLGLMIGEKQSRLQTYGPGVREGDKVVAFSQCVLFQLQAVGPVTVSLSDGKQVQSVEVAESPGCFLLAEADASGGYAFKASPHSTKQNILSKYVWMSEALPSPPPADFGVFLHGKELQNEQVLEETDLRLLNVHGPHFWPVEIVVSLDHEDRIWEGELEGNTALSEVLEKIAIYPTQFGEVLSLTVHFEGLASLYLALRRDAGLETIQARFQKVHRELKSQRGVGILSLAALVELYAVPVTRALGYQWEPRIGEEALYGAFVNSPQKGLMVVSEHRDVTDDDLREQARQVAAELGLSEIFLTNTTQWVRMMARQSKFSKKAVNILGALSDPEAFEDFLATFAWEDL